ncbi:MAG: VIT domain-containing protein, partial [Alphaproteobacteria bacterium]
MTLRKGLRLDPVHAGGIVFLLLLYLVFLSLVPAKALGAQLPAATPAWQPAPNLTLRGREDHRPISALLVGTKIDIDVAGPVARGTVTQIFTNPTRAWAEGTYVFPLPEESAVDHFTLRVGDRVIDGVVHEREEAHRMYAEAAKAGRRAGLLDQERPNIFTVSVANIPPADMVAVAFSFRIPVRYTRDHYELRMPLVVGPRYVPPRTSEVLLTAAHGSPGPDSPEPDSQGPDSPGPDSPGPGSPDVAPRPDAPATPGSLDDDALRISPPYRH